MRIACLQLDSAWEDTGASFARARRLLDDAKLPPGSLVLLPEMFGTGFSMAVARIAEGEARPSETFLAEEARSRGLWLLGGVVTRRVDGRGLNEAVGFDGQGRAIVRYTKIFPFTFGGETHHYASGSRVATFEWGRCRVAPFVCYDLRFPEIFRLAAHKGAQLLAVIANWPKAREEHWVALLRARAIENQAYVAGVNRCGEDPHLQYSGRSLILDPRGRIIAEAGAEETVISARIDLDALADYRSTFPALSDMRPEFLPAERPLAEEEESS